MGPESRASRRRFRRPTANCCAIVQNEILAQTYNPGPREAGIFYYRLPDETRGRIFSITDKSFPEVQGDGRSTLEELILRHRRLRMQWRVFTKRLGERLQTVPDVDTEDLGPGDEDATSDPDDGGTFDPDDGGPSDPDDAP